MPDPHSSPVAETPDSLICRRRIDTGRRRASRLDARLLQRLLWAAAAPLFRFSPRPAFGWRRMLLRLFGAEIGLGARVYATTRIRQPWRLTMGAYSAVGEEALVYNLGDISIGECATISQRAHLCAGTHDHRDPALPLLTPPIRVGARAWICAEAFIGPGVTIGEGAVAGARAVVMRDLAPWVVVAGNPARVVRSRSLGDGSEA